jgi:DNA-binding NarL/FixJ family response regulator
VASLPRTIHDDGPTRSLGLCDPDGLTPLRERADPPPPVRVLIADGQAVVRAGMRVVLEAAERLSVVAEATTGDEAVTLAHRLHPDVVVVDAMMPGLDSVEVTRSIRSETEAAVMLVFVSTADDRVLNGLRAGAAGLLLKDSEPQELVRAVHLLARGEALLAPSLASRLIAELASRPVPDCPDPELVDELTAREREVVALVGLGLDNAEIAERLVVSPTTAKSHVSHAMLKIGASDRAKLVVFAYEAGLVAPRVRPRMRALAAAA